jgi:hypothetical protein
MPWDTEAYDTYTVIPDSLGFSCIYRLIGINSCMPDQVVDFLSDRGFAALRLRTAASIGCNEFLFRSDFCPHRIDAPRAF